MKFSIYTITTGERHRYLAKLLSAINNFVVLGDNKIEFVLFHNGKRNLDGNSQYIINNFNSKIEFKELTSSTLLTVEQCMNKILPTLTGDLIIKLDDDALPIGDSFLVRIGEINHLFPNSVFSPYPVGLINNPGGPGAGNKNHTVRYGFITDTYYTLRFVTHVGGFARISPGFTREWTFDESRPHSEDSQHSQKCIEKGIPMFYLENALIVEHQESTLGQHERYPHYFKGRF